MSDHGDIRKLWSPSQDLSNDISYAVLSENFIISTCLSYVYLFYFLSFYFASYGLVDIPVTKIKAVLDCVIVVFVVHE